MFKKIVSFAAAVVMATSCLTAFAANYEKGDVTRDGVVDVDDLTALAAHIKGVRKLDSSGVALADVNGDNKVNVTDLTIIAAQIKGIRESDPPAPSRSTEEIYAEEVARLVNSERASRGLPALKYSPELCAAANIRAKELATLFSHTRPNGEACFTVFPEVGLTSCNYKAENIAGNYSSPASAMNGWMNSEGHRAHILSSDPQFIGVGVYQKNGTWYWVQLFANGSGMTGAAV